MGTQPSHAQKPKPEHSQSPIMNPIVLNCLHSLELGNAVSHHNLTIVPVKQSKDRDPDYDLLADALAGEPDRDL